MQFLFGLQTPHQLGQKHGRIGKNHEIGFAQLVEIRRPGAHEKIVEGDIDDLRLSRNKRSRLSVPSLLRPPGGRAFQIRHVQHQDEICLRNDLACLSGQIERIMDRKVESPKLVEHRRGEKLRELAQGVEAGFFSSYLIGDNNRLLRFEQPANGFLKALLGGLQG